MLKSGSLIRYDWYKSHEGREILLSFMNRHTHRRKLFGLLEMPDIQSPGSGGGSQHHVDTCCRYKLFVCGGRSGVGKTSTVCRLAGTDVPTTHVDTLGIQTSVIYWPIKLVHREEVIIVQLELWDAGDAALRKFDHILPACREQCDGLLLVFSLTDRSTLEDLGGVMSRVVPPAPVPPPPTSSSSPPPPAPTPTPPAPTPDLCKILVGTKSDLASHVDVSEEDLSSFLARHHLTHSPMCAVLTLSNTSAHSPPLAHSHSAQLAHSLNTICERLIYREQMMAATATTTTASASTGQGGA